MDVRMMTSNVWADVFGNPVRGRDERLVKMILSYMPDAVCLQEMHPNWHQSVLQPGVFSRGYAPVKPDLGRQAVNYTPIYYRADKWEVADCGFRLFAGPNDYDSKSVTWAKLRRKTGEDVIGVLSTHFYFKEDEAGNAARIQNAEELLETVGEMCADGVIPIFACGDMNCNLYSEPYALLREGGLTCSSLLTANRTNFIASHGENPTYCPETDTYIPAALSDKENAYSIDRIAVNCRVAVNAYTVDVSEDGRIVSDHRPLVVDATV